MCFEEADQGGEQRGLVRPAAKLLCPDSGQVEEAAGPPFVAERCRKRGKGKGMGIVWRLGRHGLEQL
jgi:hypothetical protein